MPPSSVATADNVVALPVPGPGRQHKKIDRVHEQEFLPAAVEILESPASPLGRAVALAIALFAAIAILWACVGEVDIVAVAQGKVVPTGRTKTVAAPALNPGESGVVRAIDVEDGQHVTAGQILVQLDATETRADQRRIAQQLAKTRLDIARLRSILELPGGELLENPLVGTDSAMLRLAQYLRTSQLAGEREKLASFDREIDRQEAGAKVSQAELAKYSEILPLQMERAASKQKLLEKGLTPRMEMVQIQQQLITMQRDRDGAIAHLAEAKSQIASIQRQKAQAREEFTHDRLAELAEAETQAITLDQELSKADERERLKSVRAPVSGTVQQLALHTVGGIVQPGQELMVIVPDDISIEIEAMVQNQDIGFVHAGDEAVIKLDAFPFTRYGTVPGKIVIVSEDALSEGKGPASTRDTTSISPTTESGTSHLFYAARVALNKTSIEIDGRFLKISPGMAATVEIKTGKRKLIEFFLSPLMRLRDEAGRER